MRNPLQEQLLKAGLVKKGRVDQIAREQVKARLGKANTSTSSSAQDKVDASKLQAERAQRDRILAAERNALAKRQELQAQIRQIIETNKIERRGEDEYRFSDGNVIRTVLVNPTIRTQLANGTLVIVRHGDAVELIPRSAAEKIYERDGSVVLVDHGRAKKNHESPPDSTELHDAYYDQEKFKIPDDLIW